MVETRIECAAEQAQGTVKETGGKVDADVKLRAVGKADRTEGGWRRAVGSLRDTHRKACAG